MKFFKLILKTKVVKQNNNFHVLLRLADGWYKYPEPFSMYGNAKAKAHNLFCWSWVNVYSLTKVEK